MIIFYLIVVLFIKTILLSCDQVTTYFSTFLSLVESKDIFRGLSKKKDIFRGIYIYYIILVCRSQRTWRLNSNPFYYIIVYAFGIMFLLLYNGITDDEMVPVYWLIMLEMNMTLVVAKWLELIVRWLRIYTLRNRRYIIVCSENYCTFLSFNYTFNSTTYWL